MHAKKGDRLVIKSHHVGDPVREALILEARGDHGDAPYLVKWNDGHEGLIYPGSDAVVVHKEKSTPRSG
jgi:hypothetical protein